MDSATSGRVIKFRAWNRKLRLMCWSGNSKTLQRLLVEKYDPEIIEQIDYLQFTGLKDKNGKEIYEGDIVDDIADPGMKWVIQWEKDMCSFVFQNPWEKGNLNSFDFMIMEDRRSKKKQKGYEVVGNIYENPELLK
jgi:uncharacterized phage protein (TIGR01671 family)